VLLSVPIAKELAETVGDCAAWIITGVSIAAAVILLCSVIAGAMRGRHRTG
jgi:hypothetical protein